ncbi:MAG: hypothetical protein D6677_01530 [Calditrichaeota bacterium]|nr:MAG: hypothetical protein D6677_01530 [Calditrichota bacterium]
MMTKMRQMSKWIFILVGLAFVALIVFEWGADVNRGGGDTTIGEVNGQALSIQEFQDMYRQALENERSRTKGEISEQRTQQLREQIWEQFVQRVLFQEQMEKLGITVSDSEVVYQVINHPLDDFKKNPQLQTNGVFDPKKYRAAMSNPNIPWGQIEAYYRQQIPFQKLQTLITATVRVSESEIKNAFIAKNVKAKVEYLAVLASRFKQGIKASDEEIQSWYEAHQEDYKRDENRNLAYVMFDITPSHADSQSVFNDFDKIKERLSMGEDFNVLALEYSEDPTVRQNRGDLGWFDHKTMVKPFADAAFAARPGDLVGPVKTQYGYHLIKVEGRKKEDGVEKVKASHILIKITPGPSTLAEVEDRARLFAEDARTNGWDETVRTNGYTVKTTGYFEEKSGFIPGIGRNAAIMAFAFSAKQGDVSTIYTVRNGNAYAVFMVKEIVPAGIKPLEDVKALVTNQVQFEKAREKARAYARRFEGDVKRGKAFKAIAESDTGKIVKYDVTRMFALDETVPGVGRIPEFNATAFKLEPGQTSDMIDTNTGMFFQKLLEKTAFDSSAYNAQKELIRQRLLNEKRNAVFTKWYQQLKENADIVDNRKKFNIF